jgi:hypothetical protein
MIENNCGGGQEREETVIKREDKVRMVHVPRLTAYA